MTDTSRRPSGPWEPDSGVGLAPWIGYFWARAGEKLARALPESLAMPVAERLAEGYKRFSKQRMVMIRKHLKMVCPDATADEIDAMVNRAVELYARYWFETFRTPDRSRVEIASSVTTVDERYLAEAMQGGRGAIIAMPHLGNWDVAGAYCAEHYGTPLVVAELLKPQAAFDYWVKTREKLGMEVVPLDGTSAPVRALIKALKDGRPVALVADRDMTADGIEVTFFGEKTTIPAGPGTLAARTGAPVIPVGVYIDGPGRYRAVLRPALKVDKSLSRPDQARALSQALVCEFEALIRAEPEQWHLFTPNWPSDWEALGRGRPEAGDAGRHSQRPRTNSGDEEP